MMTEKGEKQEVIDMKNNKKKMLRAKEELVLISEGDS
jgi:hypothetical protein